MSEAINAVFESKHKSHKLWWSIFVADSDVVKPKTLVHKQMLKTEKTLTFTMVGVFVTFNLRFAWITGRIVDKYLLCEISG